MQKYASSRDTETVHRRALTDLGPVTLKTIRTDLTPALRNLKCISLYWYIMQRPIPWGPYELLHGPDCHHYSPSISPKRPTTTLQRQYALEHNSAGKAGELGNHSLVRITTVTRINV